MTITAQEFLKQKGITDRDFMDSGVTDLIKSCLIEYALLLKELSYHIGEPEPAMDIDNLRIQIEKLFLAGNIDRYAFELLMVILEKDKKV